MNALTFKNLHVLLKFCDRILLNELLLLCSKKTNCNVSSADSRYGKFVKYNFHTQSLTVKVGIT